MDVGGAERESKSEEKGDEGEPMHGDECTAWRWGRGKHRSKNPLMAMSPMNAAHRTLARRMVSDASVNRTHVIQD
jgi:hypothetical protein